MTDYLNPGDVQTDDVVAHPTGAVLEAPRTNSALQLAQALQDTNEALPGFLQGIGQVEQAGQQAKAHAAALANSGQAFADAVRAGKIEPTQNPWFVQKYEQDAAQVRAQAQVSDLVTQSQQWQERNDPTAFANRLNTELGKIAQGFQGIDQSAGFNKAAEPLRQQVLNDNVEYNVKRINQENVQNSTTLATSAIERTLQQNPKATPADIWAATEDGHKAWIATGGTEPVWNLLLTNSVIGAASNRGDSSLLDILKDDRGGKGALADIADEQGRPIGAQIDSYKYQIDREQEFASMAAVRAHQAQVEQEGSNAQRSLAAKFGDDLLFGRVPLHDLQTYARQQGYSIEAVQWATAQQARALSESDTYARAQIEQYGLEPAHAVESLKLYSRAMSEGRTPALQADVFERVAKGQMDFREGTQLLAEADQTSKWQVSQGRADRAEARSDARADRQWKLETARDLKTYGDETLSKAANMLHSVGDDVLEKNRPQRDALERTIRDAITATYTRTQDPTAAEAAGQDTAARWLMNRQAQRRGAKVKQGSVPSANPRPTSSTPLTDYLR